MTASDGSSETITKARSTVIKIAGNTDGIKSGQDQFVLLLNPAIGVRVVPPPPARNRSDTTVPKTFWSIGHSGPAPIIYTVYASELKDPSTMRPTVASQLSKLGFTNADFATILAQDPFATGATSIDPKRYVRTTWTFPYEPPLQSIDCNGGVCSCAAFSGTIRNDLENELTADIQTEYSVGYSVSEGPSLPDGGTLASLNVKDSTKFTWTNSASRSATTSSSQTASVSVVCPSTQYAGPTLMAIYWDSLYGSFVFAPLDFAGSHIYQGKLPGGPVKRGETVELSYGGKTYRTVSGREGAYRFVLPASGRAAMLPQTAELSIRGVRQVVNVTPTRDLSSLTRITNDAGVAWSSVGALWTRCAAEGATCAFSGAHQVRYGANGKYATKTITGSTPCTNAIFGDPAPGVEKFCEYQSELTFQSQPNNNP